MADHAPRSRGVTPAMRDYLLVIADLEHGAERATTQRIARQLGVSCTAVTNMVKRLHERGLVMHSPYHGVRLATTGLAIAELTGRRRRLLELFLIHKLGYGEDGARIEAARLERAVTSALETHIAAALDAPRPPAQERQDSPPSSVR